MDNASTYTSKKFGVVFEGKNYAGKVITYSVVLSLEFGEYTPIWYVDSYKVNPLFWNKDSAEGFIQAIKKIDKPHFSNFIKLCEANLDSFRVVEVGYFNDCNFEKIILNKNDE